MTEIFPGRYMAMVERPQRLAPGVLCKSRDPMILSGFHGDDSPMSRRCFAQPSLADAFVKAYSKGDGFLEDLTKTIEWSAFEVLFRQINANTIGAPGYPPLTMFRIVLLQQWYNLSDPQAEEAVRDRLSFRRFCGIPLDPDAGFTVKNAKTYFGYKAHIAVDEESDLVRQAEMTSADLHDSQRGEAMIQGDESAYYADKAYDSKALRDKLASLGIDDKIAYKAKRNKPLANWQKWFNRTASSVRSAVERSNATMKNWYGMARVRYLGLARNNCHRQFVACAMNMKRGLVLLRVV